MSLRYSRRLSWSLPPNQVTAAIAAHRAAGANLLDLTVANPTAVRLEYPHDEISEALSTISAFDYTPDPAGDLLARKAIAAHYLAAGISVSPERVLLTASTSEAYGYLFKLLCDPGDEIVVPLPSYPLFEYLAALEGVRPVPYWLRYDGSWSLDFATLAAAISPRTRAIVLVNPNNPTGSTLKEGEISKLMDLARNHNLPVIADEVFSGYPLLEPAPKSPIFINRPETLTFSLNGLSKLAGMPQMKLGWIILSGPDAQVTESRERLELILDTYLSPSALVQSALPRLLDIGRTLHFQIQSRICRNLRTLQGVLAQSPGSVLHAEGRWSAIYSDPADAIGRRLGAGAAE